MLEKYKKPALVIGVLAVAILLAGCQNSSKSTNDADSGTIGNASAGAVSAPPTPPEPTRPAN